MKTLHIFLNYRNTHFLSFFFYVDKLEEIFSTEHYNQFKEKYGDMGFSKECPQESDLYGKMPHHSALISIDDDYHCQQELEIAMRDILLLTINNQLLIKKILSRIIRTKGTEECYGNIYLAKLETHTDARICMNVFESTQLPNENLLFYDNVSLED